MTPLERTSDPDLAPRIALDFHGSGSPPERPDLDPFDEDALEIPASWEAVVEEMRQEGALSVEERGVREAERLRLRLN